MKPVTECFEKKGCRQHGLEVPCQIAFIPRGYFPSPGRIASLSPVLSPEQGFVLSEKTAAKPVLCLTPDRF